MRSWKQGHALLVATVLLGVSTGCSSAAPEQNDDFVESDGGREDGSGDSVSSPSKESQERPTCFETPSTHFEIINACTDAVRIEKSPELSGLQADGSLPPLP